MREEGGSSAGESDQSQSRMTEEKIGRLTRRIEGLESRKSRDEETRRRRCRRHAVKRRVQDGNGKVNVVVSGLNFRRWLIGG